MHIEIVGTLAEKKGIGKKSGNPYTIREQEAFVHTTASKYPLQCKITPPDDVKDGYPVGKYEVDFDKSISIGEFGKIGFGLRSISTRARFGSAVTVFGKAAILSPERRPHFLVFPSLLTPLLKCTVLLLSTSVRPRSFIPYRQGSLPVGAKARARCLLPSTAPVLSLQA